MTSTLYGFCVFEFGAVNPAVLAARRWWVQSLAYTGCGKNRPIASFAAGFVLF
jgi:hypothetical protein